MADIIDLEFFRCYGVILLIDERCIIKERKTKRRKNV